MFENKDVKVILSNAGTGKCEWIEQIVPTPCGFRRFGDLQVGDFVYSAEGKATKVLGVYPQGMKDVYKITFSDGRSTECGLEHLWGVYCRTGKDWKYEVITLEEILRRGYRSRDTRKNRTLGSAKFYIQASPVIENSDKELPCNPYILGSFLGNGCCTLKFLTLSSNDTWQVQKVTTILGYETKRNQNNYNWSFYSNSHLVKTEDVLPKEVCCSVLDKSIPQEYLFASVEQRKALLQGLFDTNGSVVTSQGRLFIQYSTSSKKLCEDIRNLLLTFGIVSSVYEDKRRANINYNIRVNCSKEKAELLFSVPRKKERVQGFNRNKRRDYSKVGIKNIEKLEIQKEMMCIYVEDEKHLYLTKDFLVTHNTFRIIEEISKELETRRPEEVAFVTFTRKGAEEGVRRICNKLRLEVDDIPYFRTIHSLTFHALGLKANQMFGRFHQRKFNAQYGYSVNRVEVDTHKVQPTKDSKYLDFYDLERSSALTSVQLAEADIELSYYHRLVQNYEDFKETNHLVDFFDCLIKYVQDGVSLPCKVVYVDECQDLTVLQWKVIEKAFSNAEKIVLVGDDKQSIFAYSGARPDILINFSKRFPVEHLAMSYRLPKCIYDLSKGITNFIQVKTEQKAVFREQNSQGSITQVANVEQLMHFMDTKNLRNDMNRTKWYLLARNNCYLPDYTDILEENLIPYWTADGFFMGGKVKTKLKDYDNFRKEGYRSAEKREAFMKKYGIVDFSVPFTETRLFSEKRKYVYSAYIEKYGLEKLMEMEKWQPQILVSTIHYVKGGEAENVALLLDTTTRTRGQIFKDLDEELRLLYVAVTRTKENLFLVNSRNGEGYENIIQAIKEENGLNW